MTAPNRRDEGEAPQPPEAPAPLTVPYVTGRRKAIARALALEAARLQDVRWEDLTRSERSKLTKDADRVIGDWIDNGVLASFTSYWRG